ncbi:MAG: hypothetical protein XXXJIFNMEKO3_00208 [Candidatus Erwinia impunctatus]|nr:hypothetical protein XXXJIFNMEKO_00208 [Culicoides impunctatus]
MVYHDFYHVLLACFSQPVELITGIRKIRFTLYVEEQKLFVLNSKNKTSRISAKETAAFIQRYKETGSLQPKSYQDVTFKSSYLLAALQYLSERNKV